VCEDKLQHGVTEKFQALVVRGSPLRFLPARHWRAGFMCDRRMRQRQPQQALVAERAAKAGLEFGKFGHGLFWEHPTPNIQPRTSNESGPDGILDVGCSMLDVRCFQLHAVG
jgi:hypothetical protein